MKKLFFKIFIIFFLFNLENDLFASNDFFKRGQDFYDKKKFEQSKFLFQRSIVFYPKHSRSYLYLAKIYEKEENSSEVEKNLNTALLLDPKNEEAMYMLINFKLKKSNFNEVRDLTKKFLIICSNLCDKEEKINKTLKNIEAKNDSKE